MASLRTIGPVRRYWEDRAFTPLAALGLGAVMVALAAGAVIGLYAGDLFAGAASDPTRSRGVIEAVETWRQQVALFGAALLLTTVAVTLRRILKTIRDERGEAMRTYLPSLLTRGGK